MQASLRESEEFGRSAYCLGDDIFRYSVLCGYLGLWPQLYSISDKPLYMHPPRATSLSFSDCRFKAFLPEFPLDLITIELKLLLYATEVLIAVLYSGIVWSQDWKGPTGPETKQLPTDRPPNPQTALNNPKRSSIRPWANSI